MAWTTLGTVAPGDVLRANSGTAAYNNVIGNLNEFTLAWTSWTPAVFQNGARTSTNTQSRYLKIGRLVHAYAIVTITQAGSGGNIISCTLPFAAAFTNDAAMGSFIYFQTSGSRHVGSALANNSFGASPGVIFHTNVNNALGINPNIATANGDTFRFTVTYEAAS